MKPRTRTQAPEARKATGSRKRHGERLGSLSRAVLCKTKQKVCHQTRCEEDTWNRWGGSKETQIAFTVAPISFHVEEKKGNFRQLWERFMQERQCETRRQGTDPQRKRSGSVLESNGWACTTSRAIPSADSPGSPTGTWLRPRRTTLPILPRSRLCSGGSAPTSGMGAAGCVGPRVQRPEHPPPLPGPRPG